MEMGIKVSSPGAGQACLSAGSVHDHEILRQLYPYSLYEEIL